MRWLLVAIVAGNLAAIACGSFSGTDSVSSSGDAGVGGGDAQVAADAHLGTDSGLPGDATMSTSFCPVDGSIFCTSFDPPADPLDGFSKQGSGGTADGVTDVSHSPTSSIRLMNGTIALDHGQTFNQPQLLEVKAAIMLAALPSSTMPILQLLATEKGAGMGAVVRVAPDGTTGVTELCGAGACVVQNNTVSVLGFTWPTGEWILIDFSVELPPRANTRHANLSLTRAGVTSRGSIALTNGSSYPPQTFAGDSVELTLGGGAMGTTWTLWADDVALFASK